MTTRNIRNLLDKYFAGETSLAEEETLRAFFQREEAPADLRPYQPLFRYFREQQKETTDAGFEEQVLRRLPHQEKSRAVTRRLYPTLARIAAIVLVALITWWIWPPTDAPQETAAIDWSQYEPRSPEEATQITKSAFRLLSAELNRGTGKAAGELDKVERIGRFFKN